MWQGVGGGKRCSKRQRETPEEKKKKESKPCILLLLIPEYTKCDWVLGLWNASHKPQKGAVGGVSSTRVLLQPDEVGAKRVWQERSFCGLWLVVCTPAPYKSLCTLALKVLQGWLSFLFFLEFCQARFQKYFPWCLYTGFKGIEVYQGNYRVQRKSFIWTTEMFCLSFACTHF